MRGLTATALLLTAPAAHAGAWLQPVGEGLVISTVEAVSASRAFGPDWKRDTDTDFQKQEVRVYGEFGLLRNLTLVGQTSAQTVSIKQSGGNIGFTGLGDVRFGARMPVWSSGRHLVSAEATGRYQFGGEFIAGGDLVYRGPAAEARALYGYGWESAFLDVQAGYRSRLGQGPDTWLVDATVGYDLGKFTVSASAYGRLTGGGELEDEIELDGTGSLKLRAGASMQVRDKSRVEVALITTALGRNHVAESGAVVSTWSRF